MEERENVIEFAQSINWKLDPKAISNSFSFHVFVSYILHPPSFLSSFSLLSPLYFYSIFN